MKQRRRNPCRNSILMTQHCPHLDSASYWLKICFIQSEAFNKFQLQKYNRIWHCLTRKSPQVNNIIMRLFYHPDLGSDASSVWNFCSHFSGLKIKKILRSPFGDQLEKYNHQMQIFSCQFVQCKWCSSQFGAIHQIWLVENIADRSRFKFGGKLALFMQLGTFFRTKAKEDKMKCFFFLLYSVNLNINRSEIWLPAWRLNQNF